MSKELLKNTRFKSEIKLFFKKNKKEIIDIILFGSSIRKKTKPRDIDLLVLYKDKKNIDVSYELKKRLKEKGYDVDITDKTYEELFKGTFKAVEGILSEGYSLIFDKFLSEGFGYMNLILFRYELKGLNKSERMRFYYSLYGRNKDQKGVLKELNAIKFSDTILLCGIENSEKMKEYLRNWNIKFKEFPILIPNRLRRVLGKV